MRPREDFGSVMQYKKYLLACEYAEKIGALQNKGYLIFDKDGEMVKGKIAIITDSEFCAVGEVYGKCTMGLVCFAYGDDGVPWIEDTIKEIKDLFESYKCVNPKHIHNIKIKIPKYRKMKIKE